jgi:hypothetical protein
VGWLAPDEDAECSVLALIVAGATRPDADVVGARIEVSNQPT